MVEIIAFLVLGQNWTFFKGLISIDGFVKSHSHTKITAGTKKNLDVLNRLYNKYNSLISDMLRAKRKERLSDFSGGKNFTAGLLFSAFFFCGLLLSYKYRLTGIALYLGLWVLSYLTIYAGACRYCAYYGKKCPVPLEGSCAHHFFNKKETRFGNMQMVWATVVYVMRVLLPVVIIFREALYLYGVIYAILFIAFWIVHVFVAGCPNCINDKCQLNPDYADN